MGWEPVTTYTYDEQGRMISSQAETEWDETERGWMLALQQFRDTELCPRCGGLKSLCQGEDAEDRFEANSPTRCHLTTALLAGQKAWSERPHAPHEQALIWSVKLANLART